MEKLMEWMLYAQGCFNLRRLDGVDKARLYSLQKMVGSMVDVGATRSEQS